MEEQKTIQHLSMYNIPIKALSANQMYLGRKVKSAAYRKYEKQMAFLLPDIDLPDPPYKLVMKFGLSSSLADLDNSLKAFIDTLQTKYGFNDRDIFEIVASKTKTKKGEEFIIWDITSVS